MGEAPWELKAIARRKALDASIPSDWRVTFPSPKEQPDVSKHSSINDLLTTEEATITELNTGDLIERLQTAKLTSEAVVTAFSKRATLAQQALNCATELLFDEALTTAREYDEHLRTTGKTKGPLHGLPISVKDVFDLKGHLNSSGFVYRVDEIVQNDALLVAIMKDAGAIPFIKTNVSQGCLLVESINNVYGTVMNPWNRHLSAGGSSGGEGALVAFGGSPLGLGTDGGGSLRLPASWNGAYTLKPTSSRIPGFGRGSGYSDSGAAGYGPITNDLESISIFCETVLASQPWLKTPRVIPMPWNPNVRAPTKLKLGLLLDDGIIHLSPPVSRCLNESAQLLRAAGHEIIELGSEWASLHRRGAEIAFRTYTQEGGIGIRESLEKSGEPLVPRVCTGWSEEPLSPMGIWLNHRARWLLRTEYLEAFQALGLDAIITAPMPHPAPPHGEYITTAVSAMYNCLDWPCTTIPHGRVDLQKDIASKEWYEEDPYPPIPNFPYDRYDKDMKSLCTYSLCNGHDMC